MNDNQEQGRPRVVALHSGGLDSTVMLSSLRNDGYDVLPLSIHYGQRHQVELGAARRICEIGGFSHRVVNLSGLSEILHDSGSSQVDSSVDVPEGHYAADGMRTTVVANRNMTLLSVATMYAIAQKAKAVAYAAHAGDHPVYPDCRPEFISALATAINLCDEHPPILLAPFSRMSKAEIVKLGHQLGAPLGLSYSCYKGGNIHCGRCSTCVERCEAFALAGVPDPTRYEDSRYWREVTGDYQTGVSVA